MSADSYDRKLLANKQSFEKAFVWNAEQQGVQGEGWTQGMDLVKAFVCAIVKY